MKTVKILLEFLHGPIVKDVYNRELRTMTTGVKCIDEDETIKKLDSETSDAYNSLFHFNSHGQACWFDETKYKELKSFFLNNIVLIKNRLNEINDGTFVVVDEETDWILNENELAK